MTAYEKAHKEYEAEMRRSDLFNFVCGICVGVLLAVVAMAVCG